PNFVTSRSSFRNFERQNTACVTVAHSCSRPIAGLPTSSSRGLLPLLEAAAQSTLHILPLPPRGAASLETALLQFAQVSLGQVHDNRKLRQLTSLHTSIFRQPAVVRVAKFAAGARCDRTKNLSWPRDPGQ